MLKLMKDVRPFKYSRKLWNAALLPSWLIVSRSEESFSQCDHLAGMELMVPKYFFFFFLTTATSPWQHSPHFHAYSVFPVCAIPACHISPIPIYNTTMHAQKVRLSELRARIHTRNSWSHRSAEWLPALVINNALRNCKLSKALKVLFVHEQGITVRYATTSAKSLKEMHRHYMI